MTERSVVLHMSEYQCAVIDRETYMAIEFRYLDGKLKFGTEQIDTDMLELVEFLEREVKARISARERRR